MGLEHLDLAYAEKPPDGLSVDEVVHQAGALIESGKLRAWGLLNWPADLLAEAGRSADRQNVAMPAAVQLPYSLVRRSPVARPPSPRGKSSSPSVRSWKHHLRHWRSRSPCSIRTSHRFWSAPPPPTR